jgi:hypothetical protein
MKSSLEKFKNVERETKPVVKYHKDKKSGIRYKRTLLLTFKGKIAKTLSNPDIELYWSYDTKKNKLEIYEEKIL